MDYYELTKAFGAFFAIMNPFVNLPIFLALTAGFTVAQQRMLAMKITLFSAHYVRGDPVCRAKDHWLFWHHC